LGLKLSNCCSLDLEKLFVLIHISVETGNVNRIRINGGNGDLREDDLG